MYYIIVAESKDGKRIVIGDPYKYISLAEDHLIELRKMINLIPGGMDIKLTIEIMK